VQVARAQSDREAAAARHPYERFCEDKGMYSSTLLSQTPYLQVPIDVTNDQGHCIRRVFEKLEEIMGGIFMFFFTYVVVTVSMCMYVIDSMRICLYAS